MNLSYLNHTWAAYIAIQVYNRCGMYRRHSVYRMFHVDNLRKIPPKNNQVNHEAKQAKKTTSVQCHVTIKPTKQ
jgi:hypothetical protein